MEKIMAKTAVIIKERDYDLYLADIPIYKGMESWSGVEEEAYHFENENEAAEALSGMLKKDPDLVFVHVDVEDDEEIKKGKTGFQLSVDYIPYSSRLWFVKDITEIEALNTAFQDAKDRGEDGIRAIQIKNRG